MRRGSTVAVVDVADDKRVLYDVVLLAGRPRRLSLLLAPDLALEAELQIEGVRWTVADIRPSVDGPDAVPYRSASREAEGPGPVKPRQPATAHGGRRKVPQPG